MSSAKAADLLLDGFDRVGQVVQRVLDGISPDTLAYRPDPSSNSVAWLVWHLTRVQDDHLADAAGTTQVWHDSGWVDRFDLPLDRDDTGYGHSAEQVAAVKADAELLRGYHDAVHERTADYVRGLSDRDLDRVVDKNWNPPVTLAVRLVSVISDDLQHVGQAAYLRGLAERR
jgi:uncharacterized damage-inducible protein DinB